MTLHDMIMNSGYKHYKVAEFLGITRQQLRNIERGEHTLTSQKLQILSEKLGIDPVTILRAWEEGKKIDKRRNGIHKTA